MGEAFTINQDEYSGKNHKFLPPINVTAEYNFISGIAGITPSPDWFTGFYLFDTVKTDGAIFWDRFLLRTYPWDAGTDNGKRYTDTDENTDPAGPITRFTVDNAPNKIFVNEGGDEIIYVAEWECVLHTCPLETPGCAKEEWPPANYCDVLKYPDCINTCDPKVDTPCMKCMNGEYHADCCSVGTKPSGGNCDGTSSAFGIASTTVLLFVTLLASLTGIFV